MQLEGLPRAQAAPLEAMLRETVYSELGASDVTDDTVHLYLSGPRMSALRNHTDNSDIVVLQLAGRKRWLLCHGPAGGAADGTSLAQLRELHADTAPMGGLTRELEAFEQVPPPPHPQATSPPVLGIP